MADEQTQISHELDDLCRSVDHIKQIVAAQQTFAKPAKLLEEVSLADLVDEAIRLNANSIAKQEIEIDRQFEDCPPVKLDRHKALQILVNLITNACNAMEDQDRPRRITIKIGTTLQDGTLMSTLTVTDTGKGIAPHHMKKLFQHGFTTRKEGHGFGLHAAANDAREMGGSLSAASDGPDTGATFTLDIPVHPAEVSL